jgi:hypothetical protein
MWKEAVVDCYKILVDNLRGETEETYENLRWYSPTSSRESNPGAPEYHDVQLFFFCLCGYTIGKNNHVQSTIVWLVETLYRST